MRRLGLPRTRALIYHGCGFSAIKKAFRGIGFDERNPLMGKRTYRRFMTNANQSSKRS